MIKLYGPYVRLDGRAHVIFYDTETKKRTTVSYPKYLMEKHLGRKLTKDETVDHIDEDFTNDSLENLQVLTREENAKKYALNHPAPTRIFECPVCSVDFKILERDYRRNQIVLKKAGPFCSKQCTGVYGTDVQNNRT